jgi:hypothetical protein
MLNWVGSFPNDSLGWFPFTTPFFFPKGALPKAKEQNKKTKETRCQKSEQQPQGHGSWLSRP